MPTEILLLGLFLTVNDDFHAHLVQTVLLVLVQYVEFYLLPLICVGNLKEKPLRVPVRVDVVL